MMDCQLSSTSHHTTMKVKCRTFIGYHLIHFLLIMPTTVYHSGDFDVGRYVIVRESSNLFTFSKSTINKYRIQCKLFDS